MMARDRRYGKSSVKTRVGIATAVLVGGAVAAAAVVASHGAAPAATSAAYASRYGQQRGNHDQLGYEQLELVPAEFLL